MGYGSAFLSSTGLTRPGKQSTSLVNMAMAMERSKSLPFVLRPEKLDGTLPGDEGFDPLGLSNIDETMGLDLYWMREAELKHCRVGMLATVGALAQEMGVVLPGLVGKFNVNLLIDGCIQLICAHVHSATRKEPNRCFLEAIRTIPSHDHCKLHSHWLC